MLVVLCGRQFMSFIRKLLSKIRLIFGKVIGLVKKCFKSIPYISRIIQKNGNEFSILGVKIKLAKYGKGTILFFVGLFFVSLLALGIGAITTTIFFLLLITLYFFRDSDRVLPNQKNIVISPCDGLIIGIKPSLLPEELGKKDKSEYTKISVFMNITDLHVQRVPVDCKVKQIEYVKGAFINASLDKASKDNERNIVLFERENGDNICVVQIAGFVARRIVCDLMKDEICKIGERYGMIKFGSRIEVYVPKSYKIEVLEGQRAVCGETIFARFEK